MLKSHLHCHFFKQDVFTAVIMSAAVTICRLIPCNICMTRCPCNVNIYAILFKSLYLFFFSIWLIVPWYDVGVQPNESRPTVNWLSQKIFTPFILFFFTSPWIKLKAISIATNSPNSIDANLDTGFFNSTHSSWSGRYTQAPAPHGPGFPLLEPSVKMNTVSTSLLSICSSMSRLLSSSWSFVLFFEDPRRFKVGWREYEYGEAYFQESWLLAD